MAKAQGQKPSMLTRAPLKRTATPRDARKLMEIAGDVYAES
jgi:hypothetical protein